MIDPSLYLCAAFTTFGQTHNLTPKSVIRMKTMAEKNPLTRVTAAIMANDGKLFVARRPAGDRLAGKWEFPGGKIQGREPPEACLVREMCEEFNIEVAVAERVGVSVYHYPHISVELLAYRTTWQSGQITLKAHDAFAWVQIKDLGRYDFSPADMPFVDQLRRGEIEL